MLTGDNRRTAAVVASQLGLAPGHVHAELLPADKLAILQARYLSCWGL
jgi:cation transport ATPase